MVRRASRSLREAGGAWASFHPRAFPSSARPRVSSAAAPRCGAVYSATAESAALGGAGPALREQTWAVLTVRSSPSFVFTLSVPCFAWSATSAESLSSPHTAALDGRFHGGACAQRFSARQRRRRPGPGTSRFCAQRPPPRRQSQRPTGRRSQRTGGASGPTSSPPWRGGRRPWPPPRPRPTRAASRRTYPARCGRLPQRRKRRHCRLI